MFYEDAKKCCRTPKRKEESVHKDVCHLNAKTGESYRCPNYLRGSRTQATHEYNIICMEGAGSGVHSEVTISEAKCCPLRTTIKPPDP